MQNTDLVKQAAEQVRELVSASVAAAIEKGQLPQAELPDFVVEIPGDTSHGDFATNIAMVGAKAFRAAPPKIAQAILDNLALEGSLFARAEMAGPGFLNFFLAPHWFSSVVEAVHAMGEDYGKTDYGQGKKVMVEYVSANPTGPMHLGNARGGVVGDILAAAMAACGYDVTREFYLNDAGNQIQKFGLSLEARYLQIYWGEETVEFPEDGYQGDDIRERAQQYADLHGDKLLPLTTEERTQALIDFALPLNIQSLKDTLHDYRVDYDVWFYETSLHKDGTVDKVIDILKERGLAYESEGALWYKATEYGGEKDEVLVKGNGFPTYFAVDIAYHYNKFAVRGFEKVIDAWGSDHHGHVARLKGAMDAVGLSGDALDIILFQFVRLIKDGEPFRMSKRSGKAVGLAELLEMVPVDAARFFFNDRDLGATVDFDLDLAVKQSSENPVYYVQYAPARISSILKKAAEEGVKLKDPTPEELALLTEPDEVELIRGIAKFPGVIVGVVARYDTASLTRYATELANLFHKFYTRCRVVGNEDGRLTNARLALCTATRTTLTNLLGMLKITAPESM